MKRLPDYIKQTKARASVLMVNMLLATTFFVACEKSNVNKYNPPADHTISQGVYMHKSGLAQPLTNCVSCHDAVLRGGTTGVSCFECHNQKW